MDSFSDGQEHTFDYYARINYSVKKFPQGAPCGNNKRKNIINVLRTGEHDELLSDRTSFSPSFLGHV